MSAKPECAELRPVPKRLGIGLNVAVQLALAFAIFGALNYLGYRNYWRWDLSEGEEHTLSQATLGFLRKLSRDIDVTVILPRDSEHYESVMSLVDEYRRNGKKRIRIEAIDPARDSERMEQLKLEAGISPSQGGVLLRGSKRTRFIGEDEMVLKVKGSDPAARATFFRGEDAITSGLAGLLEGGPRKFYFIIGKGARSETATEESLEFFRSLGRQQNFEVMHLSLAEITAVPDDASGVLLAGLRYDLTEREAAMLRAYWERKGAAMLVLLDPGGTVDASTPVLDEFLKSQGVRPRGDRVLFAESTSTGPRKIFEAQGIFSADSVITKPLMDTVASFPGQTESLEARTDDKGLAEQSIVVTPLIQAVPRFWGETQFLDPLPVADEADAKPPLYLAAAIERGASTDQRLRAENSRMVVAGNAAMLDRKTLFAVNRDFIAASLNWMINREKLMGAPPKAKLSYRIQISERQHRLIFWLTALAMPGAVLGFGFLVWAVRRSA